MTTEYSVVDHFRELLAKARQAPAFELKLSTPWFDAHSGGLDRYRDMPDEDKDPGAFAEWKVRDDEIMARRDRPVRVIVRPGYRAERFASLGFDAVEAVASWYPQAHGADADPTVAAAMRSALFGVAEVLVTHYVACGVPVAQALADGERTLRFGIASFGPQVVAA